MHILEEYFQTSTYALASLFVDERRKILGMIMDPILRDAQATYDAIYQQHAPLIRFLKEVGTPQPRALYVAADMSLHAKLSLVFSGEEPDVATVTPLLEEASLAGINLDGTKLGFLLKTTIERMAEQLFNNPDDCSCMEQLNNAAALARSVPFDVNLWRPQTLCYKIIHTHWPQHKRKAVAGDAEARQWIRSATVLAENFSVQLP